ncbi:MAG: glycosyltransferase family 10 [Candidatus Gastranaerophilaceae bacterium]
MKKKTIKVNFCSFWEEFDIYDNFLLDILKKRYNVEFSEQPDFLFYSIFRGDFKGYKNCVKIFYTEENFSPIFNDCDYAIAYDHIDFGERYFRLPLDSENLKAEIQNKSNLPSKLAKRKFCNFVYSNPDSGEGSLIRIDFCKLLSKYKSVDCPGKILNNMKSDIIERYDKNWKKGKIDFIHDYKFTIAFENSSSIGYTTEKLLHPFWANSIPIYWGNPEVTREFNPKAFINCNDYKNFDEVVEKVKELDNNDDLYMEMLRQPPMRPDYRFNQRELLENFLYNIIEKGNKPYNKNPRNWDYNEKLMRDIIDYKKLKFKHYRYLLLSKVSLGKMRKYYEGRTAWFTPRIKRLKTLVKKLKAIK